MMILLGIQEGEGTISARPTGNPSMKARIRCDFECDSRVTSATEISSDVGFRGQQKSACSRTSSVRKLLDEWKGGGVQHIPTFPVDSTPRTGTIS